MVKVFGVRAAESARRKANWKTWQFSKGGDWVLNPIIYWSDNDVWQYTHKNKIPYCSLYDEGWSRLGCIGCPMADRIRQFKRWPRYEFLWKRAMEKFFESMKNNPRKDGKPRWTERFKTWQELWSWWMEEMPKEDKGDECQMGLF